MEMVEDIEVEVEIEAGADPSTAWVTASTRKIEDSIVRRGVSW